MKCNIEQDIISKNEISLEETRFLSFFHEKSWFETAKLPLSNTWYVNTYEKERLIANPLGLGIPDSGGEATAAAPVKQRERGDAVTWTLAASIDLLYY